VYLLLNYKYWLCIHFHIPVFFSLIVARIIFFLFFYVIVVVCLEERQKKPLGIRVFFLIIKLK
jgi:hypothetical protein